MGMQGRIGTGIVPCPALRRRPAPPQAAELSPTEVGPDLTGKELLQLVTVALL